MKVRNELASCIGWMLISTLIVCMLPILIAMIIPSETGMMVCLVLFFVVNPIYSAILGFMASKRGGFMKAVPVVSALMFIVGTTILFGLADYTFVLYGAYYLAISYTVMFIKALLQMRRNR